MTRGELIQEALKIKENAIQNEFVDHLGSKEGKKLYYRFKTDNTILFTIEFYAVLHDIGILTMEDLNRFREALYWIRRRKSGGLGEDIVPGLYNRNPGRDMRKDQHDNYCAIASSRMFGKCWSLYAQEIDDYGKQFNGFLYSFDNRVPYKFSINPFWAPLWKRDWAGVAKYFECARMGWNVFIYKVCAGRWPFGFTALNYVWWIGSVLVKKPYDECSGKMLNYIRFKAMNHKWYVRIWHKFWLKNIESQYTNGIADVFNIYHGPERSITKLAFIARKLQEYDK